MGKSAPTVMSPGAVRRALALGLAVFVLFAAAGGVLWMLGGALGLPRVAAFFVAACVGPLLVAGTILLWLLAQPLERRQRLLGITSEVSPAVSEGGDVAPEPNSLSTGASGRPPAG